MNYRLYKKEDHDKVDELCKKHNLPFPKDNQFLCVAENNEEEIVSICGLKPEWKIEPMIGENPLAVNRLFHWIEGIALGQGIMKLKAEIPKENSRHINHAEKEGFIIISNDRIIMEKNYNG